jgi:hypothetical protein
MVGWVRAFGDWFGIRGGRASALAPPQPISWLYTWRCWLLFMPPYTMAAALWLGWDHLADDVYGLWWIGSWTAAFTIVMIRVRPTIAGGARYRDAIVVVVIVNLAGVWAADAVLRNQVDLWPRTAIAVVVSTIALATSIAFARRSTRQPTAAR